MIAVAFALSLSFLLALISSVTPHSSRELFTELKELQSISNESCAPTFDIPRACTLIPACASTLPTKEPFKRLLKAQLGSSNFGANAALRTTPIGLHPGLLSWKVSHRMLLLYKPPAPIASSLQRLCCVKRLCNHGSLEEFRRFPSFCG